MPILLSKIIGVHKIKLEELNVLNIYVDMDSGYYINLKLLEKTTNEFFLDAYEKVINHWKRLYKLLSQSKSENDRYFEAAFNMLNYPEMNEICIGLSDGSYGKGLSSVKLRKNILIRAKEIIDSGYKNEDVFLFVGLFQPKVGIDLLSDMLSNIIKDNIIEFTKHINRTLGVPELVRNPHKKNKYIYYLPKQILSDFPSPKFSYDIDSAVSANSAFRFMVNQEIGKTWKQKISADKKNYFLEIVRKDVGILNENSKLVSQFTCDEYDFKTDKVGDASLDRYYSTYFEPEIKVTGKSNKELFMEICYGFKNIVENNNASMLLRNDNGSPREEKFAQKLFYVYAFEYLEINGIDIAPETNSGRGPIDFKIVGTDFKILIELKRLSSSQYKHGIETQLQEYKKAENINNWIYMIINDMPPSETSLKRLQAIYEINNKAKVKAEIIVIDINPKQSASKY